MYILIIKGYLTSQFKLDIFLTFFILNIMEFVFIVCPLFYYIKFNTIFVRIGYSKYNSILIKLNENMLRWYV